MRKIKLSSLSPELQSKVLDQCCRTADKVASTPSVTFVLGTDEKKTSFSCWTCSVPHGSITIADHIKEPPGGFPTQKDALQACCNWFMAKAPALKGQDKEFNVTLNIPVRSMHESGWSNKAVHTTEPWSKFIP